MAIDPVIVDAYYHAKSRCNNPKNNSYKDYGGRGIKFLLTHPWQLYALLGERPKGHQLDRINNEGNYELLNLRWASKSLQMTNRRPLKNNSSNLTGVTKHTHFVGQYTYTKWQVRKSFDGIRKVFYSGSDFFEAVCIAKSLENRACH